MYNNIKCKASALGISIRQLEKDAGLGENTIKRWDENRPSADRLLRVAKLLGTTVEELMADEE